LNGSNLHQVKLGMNWPPDDKNFEAMCRLVVRLNFWAYLLTVLTLFNYQFLKSNWSFYGPLSAFLPGVQLVAMLLKRKELWAWETTLADCCARWIFWLEQNLRGFYRR
jgi:hypothetical protein